MGTVQLLSAKVEVDCDLFTGDLVAWSSVVVWSVEHSDCRLLATCGLRLRFEMFA